MLKINGKAVFALLISILLTCPAFIRPNMAQSTVILVNPPSLTVNVGTQFMVNIDVQDVQNLWAFEFWLSYDTTLLDALNVVLGPFLNVPNHVIIQQINDPSGWLMLAATSDPGALPTSGSGTIAAVMFNCTGAGTTALHLYDTLLFDPSMVQIPHLTVDGTVTQELPWYVKPSYPDYTPVWHARFRPETGQLAVPELWMDMVRFSLGCKLSMVA